ncbi:UDP-glycosyltransferase family protein [Dyadobacter sp. CY327]|uniref:UDP-glycosyltransferase family protein n=1 Tax=Dyadobacter sp. CY327 TaxID=2907301 RepID=UPI001F3BF948|nr:UDP-glycosyltransferase family protein [Dyadobacter sp. CY327]MCE7072495.1 UDP-glycosyltransferase family protein [Dyadobacter sp. CY327]
MKYFNVGKTPANVIISNPTFKSGECFINSCLIAKANENVDIIEGVLISIQNDKSVIAVAHVWNSLDDSHFDVTKELIWDIDPISETIKELLYIPTKVHKSIDCNDGDMFEFCANTLYERDAINDILKGKSDNTQI